jgi:WS/DGAT/MGAT family acyltransferase
VRTLADMYGDVNSRLPYVAPRTIFNVSVDGARRFAGDVWPHERLKRVAVAAACTVNDVALAMCGGALRRYLLELEALPDDSLIAMVPVSLRDGNSGITDGEGNAFGSILCDLATNETDAAVRLDTIRGCTASSKERLKSLSALEAQTVSGLVMGGVLVGAFTGVTSTARQPFNLTISNIPTSRQKLYWNGAEMTELYPLAMLSEGQAINITVTQYVDKFAFGIVGCRHAVPHLQRILGHLEAALVELEGATAP